MLNRGWSDIGLSFLVGGNGKIYEGSGWLHTGAHTRGYNNQSISISFIGTFHNSSPNQTSLNEVKEFLGCGIENRHLRASYQLVGQGQLVNTDSPGQALYIEIKRWPHWVRELTQY